MKLALELATLVIGAIALIALVPRVPPRARRRRRPAAPQRPQSVERIERLVLTSRYTAGEVHGRLRPLLRQITTPLLRRRGVQLDGEPERARALLGDELWELVRAERPRPEDPRVPDIGLEQLTQMVERLERL